MMEFIPYSREMVKLATHAVPYVVNIYMVRFIHIGNTCRMFLSLELNIVWFLYIYLTLRYWDQNIVVKLGQYHNCWCLDSLHRQDINSYGAECAGSAGPWFNKKMSSYQYRKSHCGDKTILRPSYLHNGISYAGKMTSLYWIRAQVVIFHEEEFQIPVPFHYW